MTGSFFNSLDYFYIFLVLTSCLVGFFRGFVKDFLSTCSWLGSGFISAFAFPYLSHYMQKNDMISNPIYAKVVAVILSFTIILICLQLMINLVSKTIKGSMFSGVDRAFGTLYGFIRGLILPIIICICTVIFNMIDVKKEFIANSKITPILLDVTDYLLPKMISISTKTKKPRFSKESIRETERLSQDKIRRSEKAKYKSAELEKESVNYLTDLVSKFLNKEDFQTNPSKTPRSRELPRVKNKEDNVQFGCTDLMKARAKRRAQKKAERIRRDLMKRLDR